MRREERERQRETGRYRDREIRDRKTEKETD